MSADGGRRREEIRVKLENSGGVGGEAMRGMRKGKASKVAPLGANEALLTLANAPTLLLLLFTGIAIGLALPPPLRPSWSAQEVHRGSASAAGESGREGPRPDPLRPPTEAPRAPPLGLSCVDLHPACETWAVRGRAARAILLVPRAK